MTIFLLAFTIIGIAVLGMSIGVLLNDRAIRNGCGELNRSAGTTGACGCAEPCAKRRAARVGMRIAPGDKLRDELE